MKEDKKDIFLSFSEKDNELADHLYKLLTEDFDFTVFYSREDLPDLRKGSRGWNERIKDAIANCGCFISVITKNSLSRPWIVYESALADAFERDILRIKTDNVHNALISSAIPEQKNNFNCELSSIKGITKIIKNIHKILQREVPKKYIGNTLSNPPAKKTVKEIIEYAKARNIFIGGSYYANSNVVNIPRATYQGKSLKNEEVLIEVMHEITYDLLEAGFTIWCYPFVSEVGRSVAEAVHQWCHEKNENIFDHLKITGSEGRRTKSDRRAYRKQVESGLSLDGLLDLIFKTERKHVINEMEWALILGGNRKTRFESELARDLKSVKFCPIPIFDGVGLEFWEKSPAKEQLPLHRGDHIWTQETRKKLIDYLREK